MIGGVGDPPHVTSPIWGLPSPCKQALSDVFAAVAVVVAYKLPSAWSLHGVFPGLLGHCKPKQTRNDHVTQNALAVRNH